MHFNHGLITYLLLCLLSSTSYADIQPFEALAQYGGEIEALKQNIENNLKRDLAQQDPIEQQREVLAFVSFSMPEEAIKQWLYEANILGASLNIRGLVENSMPKTMAKLQKLIAENQNQGGINIDPELFESYGIKKVPAVIVRQGHDENSPFDIVYGTSSIKEALQLMQSAVKQVKS